jgi:hypothetical protein
LVADDIYVLRYEWNPKIGRVQGEYGCEGDNNYCWMMNMWEL